jgi:electron transport complex protein RnfC
MVFMTSVRGGMEFAAGRAVNVPAPPATLPAQDVRVLLRERPEVVVGQSVREGQPLVMPSRRHQVAQISPVAGSVRLVTPITPPRGHRTGVERLYEVLIHPTGAAVETSVALDPPPELTLSAWLRALPLTGAWQESEAALDLITQLHAAGQRRPDVLLCVGLDRFSPFPDRSSLLASFPDDVVQGAAALGKVLGVQSTHLLASRHHRGLGVLRRACASAQVKLRTAADTYPGADPALVIWHHAPGRRRLPHDENPVAACCVALIGPWTAIRVSRWLRHRRLDLARPMMIALPDRGQALQPRYAMPGQSLASLHERIRTALESHQLVVLGDPMTGRSAQIVDGHALVPEQELLVSVLPAPLPVQTQNCIACGWCAEVCPTSLRPANLLELCRTRDFDDKLALQLPWCVGCGLCTHVCPSHLPLAETFRRRQARLLRPGAHPLSQVED